MSGVNRFATLLFATLLMPLTAPGAYLAGSAGVTRMPMPKDGSSSGNASYRREIECIDPAARWGMPAVFVFNFPSMEKADTSNLASASSVETISTPKQIWFTVDVLESQPLVIVHFIMSSRFTVLDVKFVIATKAMYPLLDRLYTL